jgi:nucleotide-binding universal stress UspA family protein
MGTVPEHSHLFDAEAPHLHARALPRGRHEIHRILVCLDRSRMSEACLPYAVALSKALGSDMTLLYVMDPPHEANGLPATDALAWEISRQEAVAYLERVRKDLANASGQRVDVRLDQGQPAERIRAIACELNVDLTVLGSHGERGVTAWHLGSTVQQLLSMPRGSVFVAPSSSRTATVFSPTRILVPLDGSLRTESVLPTAARIARAYDAELLLVLVVPEPLATAPLQAAADLALVREVAGRLEANAGSYLEQARARLTREGTIGRALVVRRSDPRQALMEVAQTQHADLIVVSAHGAACNQGIAFGSVTAHLLAHSTAPVLVLQDLRGQPGFEQESDALGAPVLRASYSRRDA